MNTEQAMQVLAAKLAAAQGDQALVIYWLNNTASVDMLMDLAAALGAKLGGSEIMTAYLNQVPVYFVSLLLPDMPDHKVCRHERVALTPAATAQASVDHWNTELWQGRLNAQGYDSNGYFEVGNLSSPEKYYTHTLTSMVHFSIPHARNHTRGTLPWLHSMSICYSQC